MATKKQPADKTVDAIRHDEATRKNIPTAEYQSVLQQNETDPLQVAYERRNKDLDPQLVWRGKDIQDWSDLVVQAPPLYIQEKVHPKALIDDLQRQSKEKDYQSGKIMADLFSDFNGIPKDADKTEFYQHDQNWTNRMILGDSLQVMASLAEREGLRGQVQCIFFDPPYGIKFNSNFQWSTTSRDVKDGNISHITREPEQVKAFRDTWRDGIHSYLTYIRDRLTVARDLLTDSGSIFIQISDENLHHVREVAEEIFGANQLISQITFSKTAAQASNFLPGVCDYILWFAKDRQKLKYRPLYKDKREMATAKDAYSWLQFANGEVRKALDNELENPPSGSKLFRFSPLVSQNPGSRYDVNLGDKTYRPEPGYWKTDMPRMKMLEYANRLHPSGKTLFFRMFLDDFPCVSFTNVWTDTQASFGNKIYVVQTNEKVVQRCILMASDPGDIVLDPTCGSGTTANVSEQWGRRWITIDTSRVALTLARTRIMGTRYPFYILADSHAGQLKEAELTRSVPSIKPVNENIRHGFVCERVNHIMASSISNNSEIEIIWLNWQEKINLKLNELNSILKTKLREWEIPFNEDSNWMTQAKELHASLRKDLAARQNEIDTSIASRAEFEYLHDKPIEDKKKVRVAGPFTVESLSPHRILGVDENDELIDPLKQKKNKGIRHQSFAQMILENLKTSGVQQAHKTDKIDFISLVPWPGDYVCAEGIYLEGDTEKRAAVFIGPEFGTVQRIDLVTAAREAADAGFDTLIACAFNYEAHTTEFNKLGRVPVLKARMNADLHMADDLKNTGKGNLFVIFGEPDIEIQTVKDDKIQVKINGVDVFHPNTGEVRSDGADGIACWFIDTDYNEESFFVRHAYFLGANDPYSSLRTTLKAEINQEAWESLHSDVSRPFPKPKSGRIAVKVINHLGDEVMKVFKIN